MVASLRNVMLDDTHAPPQGLLKAALVNKLTTAGCVFKFWVADWFAMLNNKMDGDLAKIRKVGEYMIEVWKACGMDMTNVRFLWCSDEINTAPDKYWRLVMDIATKNNLARIQRCCTIMGRKVCVFVRAQLPCSRANAAR